MPHPSFVYHIIYIKYNLKNTRHLVFDHYLQLTKANKIDFLTHSGTYRPKLTSLILPAQVSFSKILTSTSSSMLKRSRWILYQVVMQIKGTKMSCGSVRLHRRPVVLWPTCYNQRAWYLISLRNKKVDIMVALTGSSGDHCRHYDWSHVEYEFLYEL